MWAYLIGRIFFVALLTSLGAVLKIAPTNLGSQRIMVLSVKLFLLVLGVYLRKSKTCVAKLCVAKLCVAKYVGQNMWGNMWILYMEF
jgi:hypothetical protein